MGNETSKNTKGSRGTASKSIGGIVSPVDTIITISGNAWCNLCSPFTSDSHNQQPAASIDPTNSTSTMPSSSLGKQKTGRSSYQQTAPRAPRTRNNTGRTSGSVPDKSDRSLKTSIKNVQKDVSMKSVDQRKKLAPTDESCFSFADGTATHGSSNYRRGNDYVMITDALSDVRVK
jgi:hypothetical protein